MLEASVRSLYLVDELQLGQRLNEALQQGHQAEFALLLSLLSPDVTDFPEVADKKPQLNENNELRARFSLPPAQAHYAEPEDFSRADELTDLFAKGGERAVFLAQCLKPEPLVPLKQDLAPEVLTDLPPLLQEKTRRRFAGESLKREALPGSVGGFAILGEIADSQAALKA